MRPITNVKPFGSLTAADYSALGFRAGLESHQQLLTTTKLFCGCAAGRYSAEYDAEVIRHIRPLLAQTGKYDRTALMELKTRKRIIYRTNRVSCCRYELDDMPPFPINEKALDYALRIAALVGCDIVPELHVTRKEYLDGSIPAGFQRTVVVGVGGSIPHRNGRINLQRVSLEEDSCREIADEGHYRTFATDRLGTPLVEITTKAEIRSPQEAAEVARTLSRVGLAAGLVRRGNGAARRDVNISIAGGTRTEIKGVAHLRLIPRLAHNEAMRQRALLDIRAELRRRGITKKTFQATVADVGAELARYKRRPVGQALAEGGRAFAVALRGYAGILAARVQENKRFVDELADRVRVIACLDGRPNIVDDETSRRSLADAAWRKIRRQLRTGRKDVVVVVWGPTPDARLGAEEIVLRANAAAGGVPPESRRALADGTTVFERVLPGRYRTAPDADHAPVVISHERLAKLSLGLGEPVWAREERYRKWGVPQDCIGPLAISPWAATFENLVDRYNAEPKLAATIFTQKLIAWRRQGLPVKKLSPGDLERSFSLRRQNRITDEAVVTALETYLRDERPLRRILNELTHRREAEKALPAALARVKRRVRRRHFPNGAAAARRYAMGELMAEFRGLIPAVRLADIVADEIGKGGDDTDER